MNIVTKSIKEVSINELAKALADATPEEFADFWFEFANILDAKTGADRGNLVLVKFAKAMAPIFGGKRKEPLTQLYRLMNHFEIAERFKDELMDEFQSR